jgi:hypothetical protein
MAKKNHLKTISHANMTWWHVYQNLGNEVCAEVMQVLWSQFTRREKFLISTLDITVRLSFILQWMCAIAGQKKHGKELKSRYKGLLLVFTGEDWSAESSETCIGEEKIV